MDFIDEIIHYKKLEKKEKGISTQLNYNAQDMFPHTAIATFAICSIVEQVIILFTDVKVNAAKTSFIFQKQP